MFSPGMQLLLSVCSSGVSSFLALFGVGVQLAVLILTPRRGFTIQSGLSESLKIARSSGPLGPILHYIPSEGCSVFLVVLLARSLEYMKLLLLFDATDDAEAEMQ